MSLDLPSQGSPPTEGCGLSQVRVLSCVPEPHVAEQSAHTVHVPQPPSTDKDGNQGGVKLRKFVSLIDENVTLQFDKLSGSCRMFSLHIVYLVTRAITKTFLSNSL